MSDMSAYDDLPDGVLVADRDGIVVSVNSALERIVGVTRDSVVGSDYRAVLPLRDGQGRDWWACTQPYGGLRTRTRQPERRLSHSDGFELLVTAAYVRRPDLSLDRLVVVVRGDRDREQIERGRADLVSTVAHELRSPLTSVKGFTATLLAKWDRFTDDQKKLMLTIVNADADRVTRLLTDLLDVSRIDAGRLEVRRQVVDVAGEARAAIAGRVAAGDTADRFSLVVTAGLPEMWLDEDKLQQILGNLLENAVRHGAGTVTVAISPDGQEGPPEATGIVVEVSDEGEGVSEDLAQQVFTRFWRAGNRRAGTGLGLYIVKGLVQAHGGTVEVHRAPSGGAAFRVRLPAGTPDFMSGPQE